MSAPLPSQPDLDALSARLLKRRDAVLDAWRGRIERNQPGSPVGILTRAEFYDHIPAVLNALHALLRRPDATAERQANGAAAGHGAHRWQQGFDLREMTAEWSHLHRTLIAEVESFAAERPDMRPEALATARDLIAGLIHDGVAHSVAEFHRLQRLEAEARARDIEAALSRRVTEDDLRDDHLRAASHDLHGGVSVIRAAAVLLRRAPLSDAARVETASLIQAAADDLGAMLSDLLDLSRLEAGLERPCIEAFDAANVLRELARQARPLAAAKGLSVAAHGPQTFAVWGDRGKIARITRGLLLNALRSTEVGGVELVWRSEEKGRWGFEIRDTGPGVPAGSASALEAELAAATAAAQICGAAPGGSAPPGVVDLSATIELFPADPAPPADPLTAHTEGITLSIVRRLCELLDASLELDARPNRGTVIRVLLPRDAGD